MNHSKNVVSEEGENCSSAHEYSAHSDSYFCCSQVSLNSQSAIGAALADA